MDGNIDAGRVPHEDINSRNHGIMIKKYRVRHSAPPEPPKKAPSRNPEFSALVISEGLLVQQNTEQVCFLFLSRDFLNLYLHGELFLHLILRLKFWALKHKVKHIKPYIEVTQKTSESKIPEIYFTVWFPMVWNVHFTICVCVDTVFASALIFPILHIKVS